jgi:hypothetical protein
VHYAIVNETKKPAVDPNSGEKLDQTLLLRIADALYKHMATDFAGHWENLPQTFTVCDLASVPDKASILHLVDDIPEAPDALAYHTTDAKGRPVLRLGVQTILANGGTLHTGPNSVSSAMSHEVGEAWVDPSCSLVAYFDGKKNLCYEAYDPVQGDSYDIDGIAMSNFVTSRYFDIDDTQGPWDKLGTLKGPLTVAVNGYQAFDDGSQVFGDAVTEHKKEQVRKYGRRSV